MQVGVFSGESQAESLELGGHVIYVTCISTYYQVAFAVCLALVLSLVEAAPSPFNAAGVFYNGNAASAPSFDIQEAVPAWAGLTDKKFTLGGR